MYNELSIKTNSQEYKVFLQDGFYSSRKAIQVLHKHNYAEVHVVANGNVRFMADGNVYSLKSGTLLIVPGGIFHYYDTNDETMLHTAFQIDYEPEKIAVYTIEEGTALNFIREAENTKYTQDYSKVSFYIALFCESFNPIIGFQL